MTPLIQRETASHWYARDGSPFHQVPALKGGMRNTTLRDARKVGAYPSVTNVLSVLAKPGLDVWKQETAILASLTLPRLPDETEDDFAKRVVKDMGEQVEKASDIGTRVHAAIEHALDVQCPLVDPVRGSDPEAEKLAAPVVEWCCNNLSVIHHVEHRVISHSFGYAGTVDLVATLKATGKRTVIDFKTQKNRVDANGKPTCLFYDEWPMQLAGYKSALEEMGEPFIEAMLSVVVNSEKPMPPLLKFYPEGEHHLHSLAFLDSHRLWCYIKNYWPTAAIEQKEAA